MMNFINFVCNVHFFYIIFFPQVYIFTFISSLHYVLILYDNTNCTDYVIHNT